VVEGFNSLLEHLGVSQVFVSLVIQSSLGRLVLRSVVDVDGI
jgi:hypothetical protein